MRRRGRQAALAAAVALPGVALSVAGLVHPHELTQLTAGTWWRLHVVLLPVFPLLGAALAVLLRGERGPLAWLARLGAYGYAVFYSGLDALAGIAAGYVVDRAQRGSQAALDLTDVGNRLAVVGVWAFLGAAVLTAAVLVRRDGLRAVPGAVLLVAAAVPFLSSHIYWPVGGLTLLAIGAGCALLAVAPAFDDPDGAVPASAV